MEAIETIEMDHGIVIKIYPEYDTQDHDPRQWDNLGTMYCAHPRYTLGDEQIDGEFDGIVNMLNSVSGKVPLCATCNEEIEENYGEWVHIDEDSECNGTEPDLSDFVILPLYLYDHSGITMSTSAFSCPWDSGQVGFVFIHKDVATSNWKDDWESNARACLVQEVKTYDQYLTGDIYGYVIEDEDGEHLDSCWGFFGSEDVEEQSKESAKYWVEKAAEEKSNITKRLLDIASIGMDVR